MEVAICIGSSCHLKGSREIVGKLEKLILEHHLQEQVLLKGAFCMGKCLEGVCVTVDGERFSLSPEEAELFFVEHIQRRLDK